MSKLEWSRDKVYRTSQTWKAWYVGESHIYENGTIRNIMQHSFGHIFFVDDGGICAENHDNDIVGWEDEPEKESITLGDMWVLVYDDTNDIEGVCYTMACVFYKEIPSPLDNCYAIVQYKRILNNEPIVKGEGLE